MFTSDVLKKLRRQQQQDLQMDQQRPALAPKPGKLRCPPSIQKTLSVSTCGGLDSKSPITTFSEINSQISPSFSASSPIKPAKSTPSLLQLTPQISPISCQSSTCQQHDDDKTNKGWKNSLESIDLQSRVETHDSFEHDSLEVNHKMSKASSSSSPSSSFSAPGSKASSLSSSSSSRILKQMSNPSRIPEGNHHVHSHSDSGLSSLSGAGSGAGSSSGGRTNTMSPVSTLSTLSSISSASSNGSAGGSRASIRSAFATVAPQAEIVPKPKEDKKQEDITEETSAGPNPGTDSGTGTLKRKAQRKKFQEEIDVEELSKELVKDLPPDNKLQDLFGMCLRRHLKSFLIAPSDVAIKRCIL